MFDISLALMTGVDIPIPEIQVSLHQPTIKEISLIGEHEFFLGIQLLAIDKNVYIQDEDLLAQTNNFQLFITLINQNEMADKKEAVLQVFTLLLPEYSVIFTPRSIVLKKGEEMFIINEENFHSLQSVIVQQFCLKGSGQETFNPQSKKAKEIAQKLMKARQKVAEQKAAAGGGSMFTQYLSILTVGLSMSLFDAIKLTMYRIYDLMERYSKYINWDLDIRSRLAGASADKPVENWMDNIHQK